MLLHLHNVEIVAVIAGCACCERCFSCSASDQSPLTVVSSSSPEPMLEPHSGHDDITDLRTWMKFLPDYEAQEKERLSPEIPVICPTPVKGVDSCCLCLKAFCCGFELLLLPVLSTSLMQYIAGIFCCFSHVQEISNELVASN